MGGENETLKQPDCFRDPLIEKSIKVAVEGPVLIKCALTCLLRANTGCVIVEPDEASVLLEVRILPTMGEDCPVAPMFALVRRAEPSPQNWSDGVYIGLHEPPELLYEAIGQVDRGVRSADALTTQSPV